jgi:hypothetical protein
LPTELIRYHLAKVTANPYDALLLSEHIDRMLEDMHITAAAATRVCFLGELLKRGNVSMQESRFIVNAYNDHLKEEI